MPVYQGSCHCGRTRFEIEAEIDHVRVCDSSVCSKRAALIFRVNKDALRLDTPISALTTYRGGSNTSVDYFCPVCGILPFRTPSQPTDVELAEGVEEFEGWAINVSRLDGLSIDDLPRKHIEGSRL